MKGKQETLENLGEEAVTGLTIKVGHGSRGGLLLVVTSAFKEGVIQVAQMSHHPLLLAHFQHGQVPLPEPVTPRHALPAGVAVQDVVIPLQVANPMRTLQHGLPEVAPVRHKRLVSGSQANATR